MTGAGSRPGALRVVAGQGVRAVGDCVPGAVSLEVGVRWVIYVVDAVENILNSSPHLILTKNNMWLFLLISHLEKQKHKYIK